MKTCKTCKYWLDTIDGKERRSWDNIINPLDEDTYEPKEMPFEVRYCNSPKLIRFERPIESNQASCIDGSHYCANLATGSDFGCIHHSE